MGIGYRQDIVEGYALFFATLATLFAIMDPLGTVGIFIAITPGESEPQRRRQAFFGCLWALVFMVLFFAAVSPDVMKWEGSNWAKAQTSSDIDGRGTGKAHGGGHGEAGDGEHGDAAGHGGGHASSKGDALVTSLADAHHHLEGGEHGAVSIDKAMQMVVADPALMNKTFVQTEPAPGEGPALEVPTELPDGDANAGAAIYAGKGICFTCHSLDGSALIGPSFKGIFGRAEHLEGGEEITVDEDYLYESIKSPNTKVVKGFAPSMPTMPLSDQEVADLIAYLKTL